MLTSNGCVLHSHTCSYYESWSTTDLWWKVPPLGHALVMQGDALDSAQNYILGYFYTQTSHPWDQNIGALHALHSIMAQYVPERHILNLATPHVIKSLLFAQKEHYKTTSNRNEGQTHSCLEYRPSSISASFPFLAMPCRDQNHS